MLILDNFIEMVPKLEDKDAVMQNSRFKDVWNILIALKDHDQVLAEEIDGLRFELGKRGNISRILRIGFLCG